MSLLKIFVFFVTTVAFAQKPVHLTPEQLYKEISTDNKATVIQFFNPNCEDVVQIVSRYKALQERYAATVVFYFIGITSKDSLMENLAQKTGYTANLYVADASVEADLYERRQAFCKKLMALVKGNNNDFLTLYLNKQDKLIYVGDDVDIKNDVVESLSN
ncbi:hypothetical protein AM493_02525 [Flavobacterium akiainvivens]|uniref:Thioredoxin domain-containing protein n=1 Tax=Flavobacterium akiainvivens TaxID=1202724 RepID=A0A0M8MB73_9FLAO|nr:hypothetical protein [Flavobacterium akiainvivens]KOS05034.1 hypothetical protein AM493_02525 [Flavobacterium akiainvivens]SFQ39938.1 hypothetical protein SAMN05444144_10412 [Flavobacterium akiainvivens]